MKIILTSIVFLFAFVGYASAGYVNGYYRSNGTYVSGHYRSAPNQYKFDNYSYKPRTYTPTPIRRYTPRTRSYYTPSYRNYNW